MNRKTQIYIVHGYTASSEQNWFPWLKTQLANNNINATTFDMPNSNAPDVKEWDEWLDKNIEHYNENTFFVGHSLGCIALLRYLDRHADSQKIGGFVLVSGFLNPVSTLPELDSFVSKKLTCRKSSGIPYTVARLLRSTIRSLLMNTPSIFPNNWKQSLLQ